MIFSYSCNFRSVGASSSTGVQGEAPQSCMDLCRRWTVSLAAVLASFHTAPGYHSLKPSGFCRWFWHCCCGWRFISWGGHGAIPWVFNSCDQSKFLFPRLA